MAGERTVSILGEMSSRGELVLKRTVSSAGASAEKLSVVANRIAYSSASQALIDGAGIAAALCVAYLIRFDGKLPAPYARQLLLALPFAVSLVLAINFVSGAYKRIWRFFTLRDAVAIARLSCTRVSHFLTSGGFLIPAFSRTRQCLSACW